MTEIGARFFSWNFAVAFQELEKQVNVVKAMARASNVRPEKIRDSKGDLVLSPLLVAKAQTLHALVLLEKAET